MARRLRVPSSSRSHSFVLQRVKSDATRALLAGNETVHETEAIVNVFQKGALFHRNARFEGTLTLDEKDLAGRNGNQVYWSIAARAADHDPIAFLE